jgi:4-diphosphocytidyl-2-C-methyl-D-erythritol kinase
MIVFPNAKINLGLHITAKRPDGFHDIKTVFYPVPVYDALEIIKADDGQVNAEMGFSGLPIPGGKESNLCLKAFGLLKDKINCSIKVHLHKSIPMGAGLGGGSSDAAFFINLLNDLFDIDLSIKDRMDMASQLGSDCAFFIGNKPAYAIGRGEILEEIDLDLKGKYFVLVNPGIHVSTKEAFAGVVAKEPGQDLKSVIMNTPIEKWKDAIVNDFEFSVFEKYPEINALKNMVYQMGAIYASMSGSGSSVYGIFEKETDLTALKSKYPSVWGEWF